MLHGELTAGELAAGETDVDAQVESCAQHRYASLPFRHERRDDIQFVLVAEYARIGLVFQNGQRVAHDQLIGRETAVALTRRGFRDDAADAAQLSAIGDDLQFCGNADEMLERQRHALGHAQDPEREAAANRFAADYPLWQQGLVAGAVLAIQDQAQRAVACGQPVLREVEGACHVVNCHL